MKKKNDYIKITTTVENQKLAEYNEAKKLFTSLTDLDYKPDHSEHVYFQYLLPSNDKDVWQFSKNINLKKFIPNI